MAIRRRCSGTAPTSAWLTREFAPGFAAALAVAALVLTRPPLRPWIAAAFTAIIVVTGDVRGPLAGTPLAMLQGMPDVPLMAMAGTALALVAARELPVEARGRWLAGAVALPLAFLLKAMSGLQPAGGADLGGAVHAAVASAWVLAFGVAAARARAERCGALLAAAGVVATWAAVLALHDWPRAIPVACAGVAIVTAWVSRVEEQPIALVGTAVAALVGYAVGMAHLADVADFGTPFSSAASAALAVLMAGLLVAGRLAPDASGTAFTLRVRVPVVGRVLIAAACFLWWRAELHRAYSADAATFLLIVYYAACGVAVLWRGRETGSRRLRQTGLALSVWAALVALAEAFSVQHIALRVGSYLGVGAFLLGVAWWYREEGGSNGAGEPRAGS